MTFNPFISSSD